jgi:hypothetical protein
MGILEEAPHAPDLYGLPEYKISEVMTEIDGPDVRIVCGVRKFGAIHWLYSVIVNADDYLRISRQVRMAAEQASNIQQMMNRASH